MMHFNHILPCNLLKLFFVSFQTSVSSIGVPQPCSSNGTVANYGIIKTDIQDQVKTRKNSLAISEIQFTRRQSVKMQN